MGSRVTGGAGSGRRVSHMDDKRWNGNDIERIFSLCALFFSGLLRFSLPSPCIWRWFDFSSSLARFVEGRGMICRDLWRDALRRYYMNCIWAPGMGAKGLVGLRTGWLYIMG